MTLNFLMVLKNQKLIKQLRKIKSKILITLHPLIVKKSGDFYTLICTTYPSEPRILKTVPSTKSKYCPFIPVNFP